MEEQRAFTDIDCTFLVRTNKDRAFFNFTSVKKLTTKKYNFPACFGPHYLEEKAKSMNMVKDFKKLERNLVLCRGARVMVNQNINTGIGIANGSIGTIYDFVFSNGEIE